MVKLPINIPRTHEDLRTLVQQRVSESLHLEYKRSDALRNDKGLSELSKDASAFANSDGGMIIFGIQENGHRPIELDDGFAPEEMSKERIESILLANITPKLPIFEVIEISIPTGNNMYVVAVERSLRPHQDRKSFRYHRRYNFQSQPFEDYEIQDLRSRASSISPLPV